jgi:polyphenol oxidase
MSSTSTPLPLFRSNLLARFPGVNFAMSSRQGAAAGSPFGFNLGFNVGDDEERVQEHLHRFLEQVDTTPDELITMNQVHGDRITVAEEPGEYPSTDAIITRTPGVAVCVRVADCVPIVCYVPAHDIIAGIHAGWKGSSLGIAGQTIAFLSETFGVEPVDVFCYVGPAARGCCYEVAPDVAAQFDPSVVTQRDARNPLLDLQGANLRDLLRSGIPRENIEMEPLCTICHPGLLHSHRRDGARAGRMLAVIALRETVDGEV